MRAKRFFKQQMVAWRCRCAQLCWVSILYLSHVNIVYAATDDPEAVITDNTQSLPSKGNFALPGPQQLGPLLSFGQTLIGRNNLQLELSSFSPYHIPNVGPFKNVNAAFTYGFTDNTSFYFNYPISADSNPRRIRRASLQDITLQLEQAIYTAGTNSYQTQTTIVGVMTVPLSTPDSLLGLIGYGSSTYFLGLTYNRTSMDWLFFLSPGYQFASQSQGIRFGSQTFYQAGIGHPLLWTSDKSIFSALLELDGQYTERNQFLQQGQPNSGGNVVALTPSLSLATKHTITQVGVGYPLVQHLFGQQNEMKYFIVANLTLTIT